MSAPTERAVLDGALHSFSVNYQQLRGDRDRVHPGFREDRLHPGVDTDYIDDRQEMMVLAEE